MATSSKIGGKRVMPVSGSRPALSEEERLEQETDKRVAATSPDGRPPSPKQFSVGVGALFGVIVGFGLAGVIVFWLLGGPIVGLVATVVYAVVVAVTAFPETVAAFMRINERLRERREVVKGVDRREHTVAGHRVIRNRE